MLENLWHNLSYKEVAKILESDFKKGLTEEKVKELQKTFGLNELPEEKPASKLKIFLEQFKSPLIYILIIAGFITLILREFTDSIVIFGAVIVNTIVGFFQENKASNTLRELKKIVKYKAEVLRQGNLKKVDAKDLVPGDIFILNPGDKVPADGRIIESYNLKVNEMALTGEWLPSEKITKVLPREVSLADRDNMVYMGTVIEDGKAKTIVTEIGVLTEIGKVATLVKETKEGKTPYQKKLSHFSRIIGIIISFVCFGIFVEGILTGGEFVEMFTTAVAVAVAAIPEGLPVAMTVILALGMQRILKKRGLVRKLAAAETLGSTSVICVPGNTLIWGNPSIKTISAIDKNDKALGIDRQFSTINKKYKRIYFGEMIGIKPVGLPEVEFTPEHPILIAKTINHRPCVKDGEIIHRPRIVEITKPKWVPASVVKKGDLVLVPRIKRRDAYGRFAIRFKKGKKRERIRIPLDRELSELLGWYLAEGCCALSCGHVVFYFGKQEKENIERVKYLIENKLGFKTYLYENRTTFSLIFINVDLARFFKNNFGPKANFKKIPGFILNAYHQNIIHFLRGYLKGDGRIDNYTLRFSTSSRELAHQLILLLAKIGIRGRIHRNKTRVREKGTIEGRKVQIHDSYDVFVNGTQADIIHPLSEPIRYKKRNLVLKDQNFVYFPIRSVKKENKNIEVFNIETESQTYCLPFVVHNCTDKTGTLTEAKMQVAGVYTATKEILSDGKKYKEKVDNQGHSSHALVLRIAALASEAFIENPDEPLEKWIVRGRPTEKAILLGAMQARVSKKELEEKYPKIQEVPFDTSYKYSATLNQMSKNERRLHVLGAPEIILEKSCFLDTDGKVKKMTAKNLKKLNEKCENLAGQGQRILATAYKKVKKRKSQNQDLKKLCNELVFVGFIALHDPLRKEAKRAIRSCKLAGIRPIIVTGDHKLTAKAIAAKLGIPAKERNIVDGLELEKMSDEEFQTRLKDITIYARVEPKQKMRIIDAWQRQGEVVAMTGDGINDAPALKKADIGVALGSGTEVAKETSDLILLPDNFSIIVAAIEEGRAIIDNIRKVITYLLTDSFTEMILISASILLGFPLPITAGQILWVNLIEDGLPDIALAFEPKEKGLMQRKPQGKNIPLLTKEMKVIIFIIGLITDLILLGLFFWLFKKFGTKEIDYIRTMIFSALAIDSLFYVFSCKSLQKNLWHINPFSNKILVAAWLIGVLALVLVLYFPLFQTLLKTVPLGFNDWLIILSLGAVELVLIEATKHYFIVRHQTDI